MKSKLFILFILISLTCILSAKNLNLTLTFEKPVVKESFRDSFNQLEITNSHSISKPGYPDLPFVFKTIILPPGESIKDVIINNKNAKSLDGQIDLIPSQQPYPMSFEGEIAFTEPEQLIYQQDAFYPESNIVSFSTGYYRGISIGHICLSPVRYNPVTGEAVYLSNLEIAIETTTDPTSQAAYNNNYRGFSKTITDLQDDISISDQLFFYPTTTTGRSIENDYIIITESEYADDFDSFIDLKKTQGYNVLLKTTEDIYSQYTGEDNAEKIRNFIIYAYQNLGAEYVLLGGDVETIPHRGMYLPAGSYADEDLPSDLYYGGLDRVGTGSGPDWNTDDDSYWGETDEADYYAEVYVGRISADSHTEFAAALNKQIMYQSQPVVDNIEKAIMVGEELDDEPTYGGNYKDEIVNGGTYNGYETSGFGANFNFTYHYDRDETWGWSDLKNSFNAGTNLVNHLGHSSTSYNMKFSTSNVTDLNLTSDGTDRGFFIVYSQGCYPAAFDNRNSSGNYGDDCIVEAFTTISNGCVAFLGNTRYGWYNPGGTDSGSQYLDRQFFDAIFCDWVDF